MDGPAGGAGVPLQQQPQQPQQPAAGFAPRPAPPGTPAAAAAPYGGRGLLAAAGLAPPPPPPPLVREDSGPGGAYYQVWHGRGGLRSEWRSAAGEGRGGAPSRSLRPPREPRRRHGQPLSLLTPPRQIALYAAGNVLAVGIVLLAWFSWDLLSAFQVGLPGGRHG
jgi:hypothetical protein